MKKTSVKKRPHRAPEPTPRSALGAAPMGILASSLCAGILILIFAGVALAFPDVTALPGVLGYAALYVSAIVGGFVARKRCGGMILLCGLYTGGATVLITLLISPTVGAGITFARALLTRLPIIPIAVLGGLVASYRPVKKRRRR